VAVAGSVPGAIEGAGNGVAAGEDSWAKTGATVRHQRARRKILTDDFMAGRVKEIGAAVNQSC
jgi:hypothetical protein